MSSETTGQTITVKTGEAGAAAAGPAPGRGEWKCPMGDRHVHRDDVRKVWKECQEESFWYRDLVELHGGVIRINIPNYTHKKLPDPTALPFSVGSMAVTGGLIYNGIWQSSKRFGPFPKLAVAGILGYAVGKASYASTCRGKFKQIGLGDGPGFGPGFGPWSEGRHGGPFKNSGHGHRCHHVCEECKKKAEAAPVEEVKS